MVDINFLWLFGKSPGFSQIMHPTTSEASEIYSADGVMIGKYFSENRTPVKYEEVNPLFWKALIDTEDERFYKHFGVDFTGLFAVAKILLYIMKLVVHPQLLNSSQKHVPRQDTVFNRIVGVYSGCTHAYYEKQRMDYCNKVRNSIR